LLGGSEETIVSLKVTNATQIVMPNSGLAQILDNHKE